MNPMHYVGVDVHALTTDLAVLSASGQLVQRHRCRTTISELVGVFEKIGRPIHVALEEGPLADWLYRNLLPYVDHITVAEPRRNRLIAKDSDKDDGLDAEKLAQLLRGGYLKPVHHAPALDRVIFKQHVALYHDCVRQRVRTANRIIGLLGRHGVFVREPSFAQPRKRPCLFDRLPAHPDLRKDLKLLWQTYDLAAKHVSNMRCRLKRLARKEEPIRRLVQLPGVKWVRAATFFAYIDTPGRFTSKQKLWKYAGLGLEHRQSGARHKRVRLARRANRVLKNVFLGAARSAVVKGTNPFANQYQNWLAKGSAPAVALRNTARSLAVTLWAMWKYGAAYNPALVGAPHSCKFQNAPVGKTNCRT
jgi:transposase